MAHMHEIAVDLPLDAETVDTLLGSPYFHAGFRAFAHPEGAPRYRMAPAPPLAVGDTVRWPIRSTPPTRRREPDPGPPWSSFWWRDLRGFSWWRPRPKGARDYAITDRAPGRLDLRGPSGRTVSLQVEARDDGGGATVRIDSRLSARMTRLLVGYLEAEGRDWRHFLGCGIRPLSRDPHTRWARERRGLGAMPWEIADGPLDHAGFEALLLIRHPADYAAEEPVTWAEVAVANGVPIGPASMWWDIAVADGKPRPQDPLDAHDDRFGSPMTGDDGLAESAGLFEVLGRHTVTPNVAFGALFMTTNPALHSYGPGVNHGVTYYTTDPGASIHPDLTVVPASQICSPEVELMRTMRVFELAVTDVCRLAGLTASGGHGVDALWPDGREWLLVTDYDWEFSWLGCDRATAEAVFATDGVEAVEPS